jgi:hypothetical protein
MTINWPLVVENNKHVDIRIMAQIKTLALAAIQSPTNLEFSVGFASEFLETEIVAHRLKGVPSFADKGGRGPKSSDHLDWNLTL